MIFSPNDGMSPSYLEVSYHTIGYNNAGNSGQGSFNLYLPQYKRWTIDTIWEWQSGEPGPNYYGLTKTPMGIWMFPYVQVELLDNENENVALMEPKQVWPYYQIWTPIFDNRCQSLNANIRFSQELNQNLQYEFQHLHWSASLQSDMGNITWRNRLTVYED